MLTNNHVFLIRFLLPLLFTFLPVTLFYVFDKRLHLKTKLIHNFNSIRSYKVFLVIISLILYGLYMTLLYRMGSSLFYTGFAVVFLYHYLMYQPDRHWQSKKASMKKWIRKEESHETH
ncbi:hypothetical protein [Anoxynatronum buryatiense]|uniref:Uncharacterized protein n=1 Tax=Anoxynatronum buryatiense TaxID=489973 RepID=A0AA46AIY0_9CLOT|nr:hypothetical protein [Anoxynatronum buryatiense]SMP54316.1 hypothetical protein SAMN06296020_105113 [Anoxynatronum buryatiense]